jgi:predicted DNA-binding transcriptional regulator AlpA
MNPAGLRLLDKDQVATALGIRRHEIGAMLGRPDFPTALGYYRGRWVWDEAAVKHYLAERQAARTGPPPRARISIGGGSQ